MVTRQQDSCRTFRWTHKILKVDKDAILKFHKIFTKFVNGVLHSSAVNDSV